jgi:hypothetical protein
MMRGKRWGTAVLVAVVTGVTGLAPSASAAEWRPWNCMTLKVPGQPSTGKPGVAARADGVVDVFAASSQGVYHRPWSSAAGWLNRWASLGQPPVAPLGTDPDVSAVARPGNRLSVVVSAGAQVWHRAYQTGGWSVDWEPLGRPAAGLGSAPAVSARPDGTVDVWVRGGDGKVYHRYWAANGGWRPWNSIEGGIGGAPAAAGGADGSVWVFALGVDYNFYHRVWKASTGWSAWYNGGRPATASYYGPGVAVRPNGLVDLFVTEGLEGPLRHQIRSTNGAWSGFGSLQGADIESGPNASARPGGALDVVVRKADGTVCHRLWA